MARSRYHGSCSRAPGGESGRVDRPLGFASIQRQVTVQGRVTDNSGCWWLLARFELELAPALIGEDLIGIIG